MIYCSIGIIQQNNYILSVSRKEDETDFGLPGGKVEPNETPEQGLCREILEETGIKVIDYKLIGDRTVENKYKVYIYSILHWTGIPVQMEPKSLVKWLSKQDLCSQKTFGNFNIHAFNLLYCSERKD